MDVRQIKDVYIKTDKSVIIKIVDKDGFYKTINLPISVGIELKEHLSEIL